MAANQIKLSRFLGYDLKLPTHSMPDIGRNIVSVDSAACPSLIDSDNFDYHRNEYGLFENLNAMRDCAEYCHISDWRAGGAFPLAFASKALSLSDTLLVDLQSTCITRGIRASTIEFLGIDIADSGMISGLHNCDMGSWQPRAAHEEISSALNNFGLAESLDDASAICRFANCNVPEHAPFHPIYTYAIRPFTANLA